MSSKDRQISVIIAGATGSTGREIVSRLVSHPDVSRVVALSRYPIPINRWTAVFPHLHVGDARRYLSVVPVDWEKILIDASRIPRSYVTDGVWRFEDAEAEWKRYEWHFKRSYRLSRASEDASVAFRTTVRGYPGVSSEAAFASSGLGARASSTPHGYIKVPASWTRRDGDLVGRRRRVGTSQDVVEELLLDRQSTADPFFPRRAGGASSSAKAGGKVKYTDETERRLWSQEYLNQLLQNSFYRSVFSGHQVAVNCLGTSRVLSSAELTLVDYDLSIAFTKIIRVFNCMTHAQPTEDEERLLVETTSRELDSVLWNEICTACYGKLDYRESLGSRKKIWGGGSKSVQSAPQLLSIPYSEDYYQRSSGISRLEHAHSLKEQQGSASRMAQGQEATLRHFSQVSVRAANEHSPLAYLRTQGKRDKDVLRLFNRWDDTSRFSPQNAALGDSLLTSPTLMGIPVSPKLFSLRLSWPPLPLGSRLRQILFGTASSSSLSRQHSGEANAPRVSDDRTRFSPNQRQSTSITGPPPKDDVDTEALARQRARMLLRRDTVRIWEHSNLTIWRPGVFARPRKRRCMELLFALVERPIDVKCLAECIVDDIVESFYRNSSSDGAGERLDGQDTLPQMGRTKIINGRSVARRAYMKALEDGLDEKDTRRGQRGYK